jgi:hypothetical protein
MERIRSAIAAGTFGAFAEDIELRTAGAGDSSEPEEGVSGWSPRTVD